MPQTGSGCQLLAGLRRGELWLPHQHRPLHLQLEVLLNGSSSATRHPLQHQVPLLVVLLSRHALLPHGYSKADMTSTLAQRTAVQNAVWQGRVPLEIRLAPAENRDFDRGEKYIVSSDADADSLPGVLCSADPLR
jgi:hypothetical protein